MKSKDRLTKAFRKAGNTIKPTGTCFDDAIDFIQIQVKDKNPAWRMRLKLGHGICLNENDNNAPFAHAWVELDGEEVIQDGWLGEERCTFSVSKEEFYKAYQVQEFTLYSLREMALENLIHGHFGPWKPEYHALTRNSNKRALR
jgi:hypothetical protein